MTTTNRIETERRHREYSLALQYASDHYLEAAAGDILERAGWVWQNRMGDYTHGWWVLPNSEHDRPQGDPKPIGYKSYVTVQLYTNEPFETVANLASEFRQEDRRRGLKF
jgi:hypothetical protein